LRFLTLVDLADKLYARALDEREYIIAEVVLIELVDLGSDFESPLAKSVTSCPSLTSSSVK
jgi:hypothetical protein